MTSNVVDVPTVPGPTRVCWQTGPAGTAEAFHHCTLPAGHAGRHQWEAETPRSVEPELAFIRKLTEEKRQHLRARMESVSVWLDGDDESHRAAHRLAEGMAGRKLPYQNKRQREQLARVDERIGNIYAAEIALLERIERLLAALASAPPVQVQEEQDRAAQ